MKNKILYTLFICFVFGFFISTSVYAKENSLYNVYEYKSNQTNILKMKRHEKKIYLDAGHGFNLELYGKNNLYGFCTEGAFGEADYAQKIVDQLTIILENNGYQVYHIDDLYLNEVQGNRESFGNCGRKELFKNSDADIMIQIHYDYNENSQYSGGHIIYSDNSKNSYQLAYSIINELIQNQYRLNDCYKNTSYLSDRNELSLYSGSLNKPAILIECGFGSPGAADEDYIRDIGTKTILFYSVLNGLDNYFDIIEK